MTRKTLLLLVSLLAACGGSGTGETPRVDTVLFNGKVVTLDEASTIASVVVIDKGRIQAVGGDDLRSRYSATNSTDLQGRMVMPGFVDSHTHIRGQPKRYIALNDTRSIRELKQLVRDKSAELGPGEWITGYGWSEDVMEESRRPLRGDLDEAAPHNPVYLQRAGGHSAVVNSLGLEIAGIDKATADPDGGVIERDETGELNGLIREPRQLVSQFIPEASDEDVRDSLVGMLKAQLSLGITSLVQAEDTIGHYPEWERIYASHSGDLPRAAVQVAWEGSDVMAQFGRKSGDGDEFLKVGAVKIFVDGGFTGPAAFTKEPYSGESEYRGMLNMSIEALRRIIREAHSAGWQLGIHAIGDAAIELTVDELVDALQALPRPDHRHYLNHFTVMPSADTMDAMAASGIAITQQPNFTYTLEGRYVEYLDGDRLQHNNPLRTPMQHGIHVAISSDILPIGPMTGIYAAVTRKGMSGKVFGADEKLTVNEALRAYTSLGAWLTNEEDRKGTIETGKFADLVVLDQDILNVDPDHIMNINVVQTWLGGKLVYQRE
ncbi:MAG: amidohydrolase [Gammaproteobacteria bacterium]|nr:amidohydrolase [Gammaproteobacteria bacterium]